MQLRLFTLHKLLEEGWAEVEDQEANLEEFGYTNDDMIYLPRIHAAYRYMFENKPVFMLHPDNISVQVCCMEDISKHMDKGEIFGYKNPYQEIQFVMNDRFYEDGWAEPYLIRAKASKDALYITLARQIIANNLAKEDELPSGLDGITKIFGVFQQENPGVIKNYKQPIYQEYVLVINLFWLINFQLQKKEMPIRCLFFSCLKTHRKN